MNPLIIKKIIGGAKKLLSSNAVRTIPGSGIIDKVEGVIQSKWEVKKVLGLAVYVLSGAIIWAVIFGKIDMETAKELINAFGLSLDAPK